MSDGEVDVGLLVDCEEALARLTRQRDEARRECERLRAALQDIADDPIVRPHREERRGISEILTIARNAIDAAMRGEE